jgi:bacteriocin biosynthesis cyclodehydratase domain-containing protein
MDLSPGLLRALPVQVVEIDDGVVLKRGCVETSIRGKGAVEAVQRLLQATSGGGMDAAAVRNLFADGEHADLDTLIEHLRRRGLLVSDSVDSSAVLSSETPAEVFYWHFGVREADAAGALAERRMVIIGLNGITRQLARSLSSCGVGSVSLVDDPLLRNPELLDEDGMPAPDVWSFGPRFRMIDSRDIDPDGLDCLVATSEFGASSIVARWNEFCVLHKRPFLPVVLKDLVGWIGPLVIPGETACYECARMRQRAHQPDPGLRQAIEAAAQGGPAGFLPPMSSMLADMAAIELIRFFCLGDLPSRAGTLIEVSVLAREMTPRPVLKLPRCPVCTPIDERPDLMPVREPATAGVRGDG